MPSWVERVHTCVLIFGVAGGEQAMAAQELASLDELLAHPAAQVLGPDRVKAIWMFLQASCVRDQSSNVYVALDGHRLVSIRQGYADWHARGGAAGLDVEEQLPARTGVGKAVKALIGAALQTECVKRARHVHHSRMRSVFRGWRLRGTDPAAFQRALPSEHDEGESFNALSCRPQRHAANRRGPLPCVIPDDEAQLVTSSGGLASGAQPLQASQVD